MNKPKIYDEAIAKMRQDGVGCNEIARMLGINRGTVSVICKRLGCRPIKGNVAEETVAKYAPDFEYISGYTDHNGYVDIRCKVCGYVMRRTCVALRHNSPKCENCQRIEAESSKAKEAERKRIKKEQDAIERQKRIEEAEAERLMKEEKRWHDCPVCGERTNRTKYCSRECASHANNTAKDIRRRAKISGVLVDKDITLSALFKRDGGVCHICGGRCLYEDYTTRQGQKISGDWYPSIDHVVPLAKGGEHSWQNVKLAHRRCNYIKRDGPLG